MYKSKLSIKQTQKAIKELVEFFENQFSKSLNLLWVTAPLFVDSQSGLNDGLNGEKPVSFCSAMEKEREIEIVHSLAKWKRSILGTYSIPKGKGIFTNMRAIRREEYLDNIHSLYVDQWDWEQNIDKNNRNYEYLIKIVNKIYKSIKLTEKFINSKYSKLKNKLPNKIYFITSDELEKKFPNLSPEQREYEIVKNKKAVFISKIGHKLELTNKPHGTRAADYDDWNLNGDIIVWDETINNVIELSSMGIRVDAKTFIRQSQQEEKRLKLKNDFYKAIIEETIPFSIGGGIGQSRLCMFLLEKKHIGEIQPSIWPKEYIEVLKKDNIFIL